MLSIGYYCDPGNIETNALEQLEKYAQKPFIERICAFTDVHYCDEKAIPVGVAFRTADHFYPLITGKDIGCGVMYLKLSKEYWLKPFDKKEHYQSLNFVHSKMTDDGLGGGNHFLSIEEDDDHVYILCHTGTRNRGIALYQQCLQLTRDFSQAYGAAVDFVHSDFLPADFVSYYESVLQFGYERRKDFCLKTMVFLQQANYLRSDKTAISKNYLQQHMKDVPYEGKLHGTPYVLEDSVHNHIRFGADGMIHRKGSTELNPGNTVVIPLSMSRGSLLVKMKHNSNAADALYSCAHGAGRALSRFEAMKYWKTVLKEKDRKAYRTRFPELLGHNGDFPSGYMQEFDFAYKDASTLLVH